MNNDLIHCHKCKKRTKNINATKIQTVNGRWRISTKCFICKTNKNKLLLAKELHKPVRKRFPKRRIITHGIDDLWAVDLVIMRNFSDENEDTFSKFAWAFPLKKKDGISVSKAFEKIIEQAKTQNHQTPKLLHADKEKSAIIERFNRTLNGKMRLCFEVQKSKKWINILQNLLDEYNFKDIHRSIGMKPCEVNKSNEDDVLHKLFSTKNKPKPKIKFSVGDRVRIKAYKKTFGNKYSNNWTKEIFILKEILNTNPITYKIIDLNNEEIEGIKKNDNINKMDNKKTYPNKTCDKCNLTIDYTNWSAHLKSVRHGKNDIDQTIVPFRFNRTYKGIPINQENEKKYNYIKLMKNDIKKYVKKNQKKIIYMLIFVLLNTLKILKQLNIIYIKLQLLEIYSLLIKGTINLEMEILIFQLCKIANDLIITTGDYTHHYLDDIKIVEDLGNIKMCEFIKRNVNNNKMDNKKTYPNKICDKCNLTVSYKNWSRHLKSIRHQTNDVDQTIKPKFNKTYKETKETAFESRLITYIIKNNMGIKDIQLFLNRLDNAVIGRLKKSLTNKNLKVNIMFLAIFKRGSSYIPLPENIKNKHAIINVKNEDDKCFLWAILSALHPVKKHAQRVTKYIPFKNDFDKELKEEKGNNTHIIVPLEITKIEKTNHIDLMYLREDNENKGHYCWIKDLWKLVGSQMTKDGHRRLLCKMCLNSFDTENKLNDHKHYCGNNKAAKIVLPEPYNKTLEFEKYNNSLRIPFVIYFDFECTLQPIYSCQPNDKESFTKCYQKHIPNNFCYYIKYSYGDYKPPVEYSGPNVAKEFFNCIQNEEIAISEIYDEIVPMETLNAEQLNNYNKSDKCHICERFLSELPPRLEKKLKIYVAAIEYYKQLNDDDNMCLYKSKIEEAIKYKKLNMRKVCDHDHLTGEYRGAAHSICNLTYKNPTFIPIVCHNLSGYDAHLFIKQFGNDNNDITLIPNNEEKYISFSKIIERTKYIKGEEIILKTELRFIDSFKFLSSSLDKLTNNLEKHQFKDLKHEMNIEDLISLVQERHNRNIQEQLWKEISDILKIPANECKAKWTTLRNSFSRQLREQKKLPFGSGASSRKRKWYLFDNMLFLSDYVLQHKKMESNLNSSHIDNIENDSFVEEPIVPDAEQNLETVEQEVISQTIVNEDAENEKSSNEPLFKKPRTNRKMLASERVVEPMLEFLKTRTQPKKIMRIHPNFLFLKLLDSQETSYEMPRYNNAPHSNIIPNLSPDQQLNANQQPQQFNTIQYIASSPDFSSSDSSITRKLAYPYEYMDCEEKFNETCLPPREKFYSSLTGKNITIEEYENSQKIWEVFKIQNLREFTSLYNKIDVLLLTDIMENFRDISLKKYKLDPLWYYTTPGFAWDSMLRMTKVKLDLLTDIDQILMFESGIRGGLSQCSQRYSKANNKYMGDKFKKKEESIFLQYLDANNLYGWAMSKYLPTGDFKWVNNLNNFDVMSISDVSPKGYILEVDLSYSKELHDLHSDFPLAPEKHFDDEQLPKLLTSLYDKKKYIIHYETLKLYIKLGLKITKIHRVLEFSQSPWLKVYIDFNTDLRSKAKNEFEKDYFKLMNNSVYGRTMMNVRNHVDIRLCSNEAKLEKLIVKPNFDRRTIFTENLVAIHMKRTEIFFKQPIYIGMCILDLSKSLMYDFYYNTIKKKYGNRVRLLYTDTDSLILEIKTDDFYQDIKINLDHFDTSDYPKDNIYDLPLVNKKVLDKFKDELNGKVMTEFIGLRSKLYSHQILDSEKEIKKSKGVKKNVVENKICFDDFKNCLLTKKPKYVIQNLFRTKKHDIFTVEQNKKALSVYDDKRFILNNGIDTLAWGHYKTNIDRNDFVNHLNTLIRNQNQKD
ncbi:hypothetical protein AGLY_016671 [Aphis glycines]|uniref:Uncharacterized protein n=1 Tax=Aphis glycines TaxID=307491 RepID=A0A6G0SXB7_APHGL|nr:hypothetical protein AGLY_016671 [Aphis glycines]